MRIDKKYGVVIGALAGGIAGGVIGYIKECSGST
jgi:hypothetical protein